MNYAGLTQHEMLRRVHTGELPREAIAEYDRAVAKLGFKDWIRVAVHKEPLPSFQFRGGRLDDGDEDDDITDEEEDEKGDETKRTSTKKKAAPIKKKKVEPKRSKKKGKAPMGVSVDRLEARAHRLERDVNRLVLREPDPPEVRPTAEQERAVALCGTHRSVEHLKRAHAKASYREFTRQPHEDDIQALCKSSPLLAARGFDSTESLKRAAKGAKR